MNYLLATKLLKQDLPVIKDDLVTILPPLYIRYRVSKRWDTGKGYILTSCDPCVKWLLGEGGL